jgi:DnaJ-class molecular chaperone
LVEIDVAPHPYFQRIGDNVLIEIPVALDEAILGASIRVPTVIGTGTMKLPKGSSSGKIFRLRGKGILNARTSRRGDQLVKIRIVLPKRIDPELSSFIKEWRKKHAYDPRENLGLSA